MNSTRQPIRKNNMSKGPISPGSGPEWRPGDGGAVTPAQMLLQQATAYQLSQAIWVVAELSIADHLQGGPMTVENLASVTGCYAPALYRLLRALAAFQIFREVQKGRFALGPKGECLRSGTKDSIRALVLLFVGENFWHTWSALLHSVRTGETAFPALFGVKNSFEYYAENPEDSARMNDAMTAGSLAIASAVVAKYDFPTTGTIADIGGGHGTLISSVLKANPGLRGILFDFEDVASGAIDVLKKTGVADRCDVVPGDMFATVPTGGDIYLISRVINICDEVQAVTVLKNCRAVMAPAAKVVLIERVLPEVVEPTFLTQGQVMSDLTMLVRTGGRERTAGEFRALLSEAGLCATRILPTDTVVSLIEAVPAQRSP
jgi:hypothetical protein